MWETSNRPAHFHAPANALCSTAQRIAHRHFIAGKRHHFSHRVFYENHKVACASWRHVSCELVINLPPVFPNKKRSSFPCLHKKTQTPTPSVMEPERFDRFFSLTATLMLPHQASKRARIARRPPYAFWRPSRTNSPVFRIATHLQRFLAQKTNLPLR